MKRSIPVLLFCLLMLAIFPAFANDSDFVIDKNGVLTAYTGNNENIVIPDEVKAIGNSVFYNNTLIKNVSEKFKIDNVSLSVKFPSISSVTPLTVAYVAVSVAYEHASLAQSGW